MPAINSLMKGQGVEQGARIIGSTLKSIRYYAITHKKNIALIFPTTASGYESISADYANTSFRPCAVTISGNTYSFDYWVQDEKWQFMPISTAVLAIDNSSNFDINDFTAASEIQSVDFSDVNSSSSASAAGIIFKPTGQVVGQMKFIVIGNLSNIMGAIDSDTGADTDNTINIVIDQYSGRVSYSED